MGLIQCALNCKYQLDGYCNLEKCSTVSSKSNDCPYFKSADNINGFLKTSNADKGNAIGNTFK